jgi:UDP-N-acetylmuramoylalanine--D-glutamate ligase
MNVRHAPELRGKRALVVGLARSGVAAARFLAERGARVVATDAKPLEQLGPDVAALQALGVALELGGHRLQTFVESDLVVVSPGVPWERPELLAARQAGADVLAELELGARFAPGPIAAVTGTKGKSTTTAALGAMLRAAGLDVRVGGNIGAPLVGLLEGTTPETRFALEVSSFQLEGTRRFHPRVALFLNLSPDHLDRHPGVAAYAAAKARVFENQGPGDWAVLNADDPQVLELARSRAANPAPSSRPPRRACAWVGARRRSSTWVPCACPAPTWPSTCSAPGPPRA